ncbi:ABC transporter permease [Sansalvadorimonas sp. 2012CJ34-2]|uniref:ABC transporter permease n=1 Tax=Parendozoicomonas callyspongiae TaxID=2942213 RepID=A0ABT0PHF8_9GAMM|nr:ABC transporter permease [Sansalvadorimonas sp. 2012CJ34-2]MCL6270794.1 ABC transporter permease [Sansalvadorimonas sp. 2012CJ34-2]
MDKTALNRYFRNIFLFLIFCFGVWAERTGYIEEMAYYQEDVIYLAGEHLYLTLVSGGLAVLTGVPLGIYLSRPKMAQRAEASMQLLNIGGTIPTLALLALAMSVLGIGNNAAIFGLWVATLLPIVRNTFTGLRSVPAHMKEAARGMGMTPGQMLRQVELPNSLFVIMAGIRTALAINIGTAPLAFLIGGTSLGELIFTGIAVDDQAMMLAGAITTALLAVVIDFALGLLTMAFVSRGVNPLRQRTA